MINKHLLLLIICLIDLSAYGQNSKYEYIDYDNVIKDFQKVDYKSSPYWEYVDFYSIAIIDSNSIVLLSKLTNDSKYSDIVRTTINDSQKIQFKIKISNIKNIFSDSLINKKIWTFINCKNEDIILHDNRILTKNNIIGILVVYCDSSTYYYKITKNIQGFKIELAYKDK